MPLFYFSTLILYQSAIGDLTPQIIHDAILENNDKSTVYQDPSKDRIYARCENKPRNMPLYGVEWIEVKDENK